MIATTDLAQRTLDQGESVPAASWNNNTQPALHLPPAAVRFAHMTIDDAAQSAWQPVGHIKWTTQEEVALGLGARQGAPVDVIHGFSPDFVWKGTGFDWMLRAMKTFSVDVNGYVTFFLMSVEQWVDELDGQEKIAEDCLHLCPAVEQLNSTVQKIQHCVLEQHQQKVLYQGNTSASFCDVSLILPFYPPKFLGTPEFPIGACFLVESIRSMFAALFLASIGMLIHVRFLWNHVDILLASVILVVISLKL
ncbi:hypothetical protein ACS0TY_033519 [Phlomoides rotata]